ncbi:MAG: DUF655 domain-containing protein [Candidatus Parvarchaeota archaeon]|jgi:putative nucleotide binding protein|nr:DUF655 domain-containing protein [Candidatus Parvarchaeota archaeon]
MGKDEYAYVLEYLPFGLPDSKDRKAEAIILTDSLGLLLVALKKDVAVEAGAKVYIGENKREEVHHIIQRTTPDKLNGNGMQMLTEKINSIVTENEEKYIGIINKLGSVNVRLHSLSLIPGVGKKMVQKILDERNKGEFKSYSDFDERVGFASGIARSIAERIEEELENRDKYKIFT